MKVQGWIAMPAASSCDMRGRIAGPGTSLPFKSWFGQPHVGEPPGLLSCSARTSPRPSTPSQTLSSANGAGPDVMISTRSAGLLIDTVVCLTLAKWETVSGRFGGYLSKQVACADTTGHPLGAAVGFSRLCLNRCRTAPNPPFPEHRHSPRRRPLWNASKLLPAACVPSRSPLTATPARLHAARADLGLVPTPLGIDCNPGRGGPRLPSARSSEAVVSGPAFATYVEPSPCHDLA